MAIPSEISRLIKNNHLLEVALHDECFKEGMKINDDDLRETIKVSRSVIEKAINHAELYYRASREQIAYGEVARLRLEGKKCTRGCILPDLHEETMCLKKLEARLKGRDKKRVKAIVKCNLEALQASGFLKKSSLSRIQWVFKRSLSFLFKI